MPKPGRHPALKLLFVVAVVAALTGAGVAIVHLATISRNSTTAAKRPHGVIAAAPSPGSTTPGTPPTNPAASSTATSATPANQPGNTPASPKRSAARKPPATQPVGAASPEDQVLTLINQARASQGVPPLTRTAGLNASASGHNHTMANGCGLSHQCPGEPSLGDRETAAGVQWHAAGENIGEGGPVANTTTAIASMAVGLTKSMLAEVPPDDGHRRNILSADFHHIGLAVMRDSSGTVWLTQDFSD